ncbi:MAG: GtrA family protein, partial [Clostridia bacterium]|nr:GtrA family protein [Clostridia bacterium]
MFATVKRLWNKYRELIRYLIVGVLTTAVSLGVYWLATATVLDPADPVRLQAANVLSWIAAVTFAYFANRIFVFQSKSGNVLKEAGAFFLSRVGTLLLDMAIMFVAVTLCRMGDKPAKLIVQVVVTVVNYLLGKFVV